MTFTVNNVIQKTNANYSKNSINKNTALSNNANK